MNDLNTLKIEFRNEEEQLLTSLRKLRRKYREATGNKTELTIG